MLARRDASAEAKLVESRKRIEQLEQKNEVLAPGDGLPRPRRPRMTLSETLAPRDVRPGQVYAEEIVRAVVQDPGELLRVLGPPRGQEGPSRRFQLTPVKQQQAEVEGGTRRLLRISGAEGEVEGLQSALDLANLLHTSPRL